MAARYVLYCSVAKPDPFLGQILGFKGVGLELMQQLGQLPKKALAGLGTSTNVQKDTKLQK